MIAVVLLGDARCMAHSQIQDVRFKQVRVKLLLPLHPMWTRHAVPLGIIFHSRESYQAESHIASAVNLFVLVYPTVHVNIDKRGLGG